MGYTHYWRFDTLPVIPAEARVVLKEILDKAYADGIIQYEADVQKEPFLTDTEIRFNGVGEDGHETFHFNIHDDYRTEDGRVFAFCKTAKKPYDAIVMRVLITLKYFLRDGLNVSSDGSFGDEWIQTRTEMADKYGMTTYVDEELTV